MAGLLSAEQPTFPRTTHALTRAEPNRDTLPLPRLPALPLLPPPPPLLPPLPAGISYYEEYKTLTGVKVWACFSGGVACVIIGVLVLTRKSTSKVVDVVVEIESQQSINAEGEVDLLVVDGVVGGSGAGAAAGAAAGAKVGTSPPGSRSRSITPARDRKPTAVQLSAINGYVRTHQPPSQLHPCT